MICVRSDNYGNDQEIRQRQRIVRQTNTNNMTKTLNTVDNFNSKKNGNIFKEHMSIQGKLEYKGECGTGEEVSGGEGIYVKNSSDEGGRYLTRECQILIQFDGTTYVLSFASSSSSPLSQYHRLPPIEMVLSGLSQKVCLPSRMLQIHEDYYFSENIDNIENEPSFSTFITAEGTAVTVIHLNASPILTPNGVIGGKGGFGTLLKGQSKMAGARRTVDFGACRDLNGRRLRHVNDEIKLRKWRDAQRRREARRMKGDEVNDDGSGGKHFTLEEEMDELRTSSGIRNWHLMVPNWADMAGTGAGGSSSMTAKGRKSAELNYAREAKRYFLENSKTEMIKKGEMENQRSYVSAYASKGLNHDDYADDYCSDDDDNIGDDCAKRDTNKNKSKMNIAIIEGMKKRKDAKNGKRRGREDTRTTTISTSMASLPLSPSIIPEKVRRTKTAASASLFASFLYTLSGDFIIIENDEIQTIAQKSPMPEPPLDNNSKACNLQRKGNVVTLRSVSEFATACILLPSLCSSLFLSIQPQLSQLSQSSQRKTDILQEDQKLKSAKQPSQRLVYYYEIIIRTGGLTQLGWAYLRTTSEGTVSSTVSKEGKNNIKDDDDEISCEYNDNHFFHPNCDEGEGVGDDQNSYGYDGGRGLIFHNGKEIPYGSDHFSRYWKQGDVVGCFYDVSTGDISYTVNGLELGHAFSTNESSITKTVTKVSSPSKSTLKSLADAVPPPRMLHPAFSLNANEEIDLNIGPEFKHFPHHRQARDHRHCFSHNALGKQAKEIDTCNDKINELNKGNTDHDDSGDDNEVGSCKDEVIIGIHEVLTTVAKIASEENEKDDIFLLQGEGERNNLEKGKVTEQMGKERKELAGGLAGGFKDAVTESSMISVEDRGGVEGVILPSSPSPTESTINTLPLSLHSSAHSISRKEGIRGENNGKHGNSEHIRAKRTDSTDNNNNCCVSDFDLDKCKAAIELEKLGMDRLKYELLSRGCKYGGSMVERARRLFSLKGLRKEEYPKKVFSKGNGNF